MKAYRFSSLFPVAALALGCSPQVISPPGGTGASAGTSVASASTTVASASTAAGTGGASGSSGSSSAGGACSGAKVQFLTQAAPSRVDLVLAVDNSASMADKQQILALAIPDLIDGLVNPKCVDPVTRVPVPTQPSGPLAACLAGSTRAFAPVLDMHVGLLSSSLGTFGADGCPEARPAQCGGGTSAGTPLDDHGHLVTRSDPCGQNPAVATYQNQGFLAWDPAQVLTPPGEANLGDPATPTPGLTTSLHDLVVGNGQFGCGFESQDESWYRFLVDPSPYQSISLVNNQAQPSGVDAALLQQRKEFLRPDSLLAIVVVSDETDTSIKEFSSYPLFAAPDLHLPHARSECTTKGPTDPCCASCGQATPMGCPAPGPECSLPYSAVDENTSLRAFGLISHKQRYGIEFFYPPSRYVQALTGATVTDNSGKQQTNPIFSNLDPAHDSGAIRTPELVLYSAIVGVPWQLIARQKNGVPDLVGGVSALDPSRVGGFKTAAELGLTDAAGNTFWDDIAGDPENYVPARSPFMQEATSPRSGTDPITGAAVAPPTTPNGAGPTAGGAPINDHERSITTPASDIEYACVFPILQPIDCSVSGATCDCTGATDNPLCAANPNDSGKPTLQVRAKAYPGVKELAIAKGLGAQGVVASICAKQVGDPTADDFGYHPAVKAITDRIQQSLGPQCLPEVLPAGAQGQVSCAILEARNASTCDCSAAGRAPVSAAHQCDQQVAASSPRGVASQWNCFCEIPQASGAALTSCRSDTAPTGDDWCYLDASAPDQTLVADCPAGEKQSLRFVGAAKPVAGATLVLACP